jgi:hypothetical protein
VTQKITPGRTDHGMPADQPLDEAAPPTVSAFVAAAITEHGRNHGLTQLLADLAAGDGQPTDGARSWARDALGVS